MLAIARTTKLTTTSTEKVEDETLELDNASGAKVETEFYGGEQTEEPEDKDVPDAEAWRPKCPLRHNRLTAILARHSEIAAAARRGRKSAAVMQMKIFDDCFHTELNTPVLANTAKAQKAKLSYANPHAMSLALLHQDAILKDCLLYTSDAADE